MFIHKSRLDHRLRPEHYFDERHYQCEIERLFLPAWHFVGTKAELARPGDFLTLELLGQPVLVRNIDGEIHSFLNVCAHRHCLLTHEPRGHEPRFRCQYHGWEYTKDGRTAKIPEAHCFKPWDRENAQLQKFRTATAGELVFVALSEQASELKTFLGDYQAVCDEGFAPPFRRAWTGQYDLQCNWKVPVENTLEAYHIPCLHPKTLKEHPTEENSDHRLHENWTTLLTPEPPSLAQSIQNFLVRRLGATPTNLYIHHHIHPNIVIVQMDVMRLMQVYVPTSPTSCRLRVMLYTLRGQRRGPVRFLIGRLLSWLTTWVASTIIREDRGIFPVQQRGLAVSPHPGVIGTLEERLHIFQNWVLERCGETDSAEQPFST